MGRMRDLEKALPLGLVLAWVVNDVEEWFTMAQWSAANAEDLAAMLSRVPWPEGGMSARQAHLAIGIVGVGIGAASLQGWVTGGRSRIFRSTLLAFGLHGFTHVGQSVALRRYTPGVVTGAGVVIPFWLWARAIQKRSGTAKHSGVELISAAAMLASLPVVVAAAGAIDRGLSSRKPPFAGSKMAA